MMISRTEKIIKEHLRGMSKNFDPVFEADDLAKKIEADRWISVDERLPKFGERVLLCGYLYSRKSTIIIDTMADDVEYFDYGYTALCGIDSDIILSTNDFFNLEPHATHWMPLPEPPK